MKKPYSFFLFSLLLTVLCLQQVHSQTTRTVGSGGNYTTLKGAFDAINAGTITGTIILHIISNTTETATAVLNASGTGSANYSAVAIYPTGTGGWTITGSLTAPIINLNGADNVTIDGRVNQTGSTKSLTIANTNTGGAVIQLIADATANTIRYCIVRGVTISATSGVIIFSTGTSTGNDNNTIEYCDIRDEATTPTNAIYSAGSSVAVDNSGISITTCNIFNFFAAAAASNGIFIASNSSAWTITGNRFFQAATRTATTGATHRVINIVTASGVNYTVSNNIIGFANEAGTGVTTYTGAVANLYRAIELITGTATASSIQGNTISAITLSTTSNSTTLPGIFSGISILAGSVNVGTTTSNTLGATTGNGAIQITTSTTTPVITGIYATTTGTVAIQNNNIGAISTGGGADIGYTFHGINTAGTGGNITITANTIGSTSTDNSINVGTSGTTTTGVCTFNGINNAATGAISIDNNTVQNCSAFGTAASIFRGILNSGGSGTLNISSNNIIAGTNTGTGAFAPISNSAVPLTLNINDNIIRNHSKTAATGTFTAIDNSGAVTTAININNNQLGNTDGGLLIYAAANSATLLGISNTTGATGCALSIQNNDIRGIVHSVAGTNDHTYIINSAATLSKNISSNTFTNLSVNTTGAIIFISNNVVMPANGVQNVNSNSIVTAFTRTAASGAITLFTSTLSTANTSVTVNNNGNNFSNITISGTATILGWINTDAGTTSPVKTIDGNTFSNWTGGTGAITAMNVNITSANNAIRNNNINTISSSGAITGITTAAGNDNIFSNTIHTLVSTGATTNVTGIAITAGTTKNIYLNEIYNLQANNITTGSVNGIAIETSTTNNVYRNRIYDLSSSSPGITTGTVSGILVASGTTHNIYNNRIANLSTSAANVANPLRGINVTSTTANSTINVYYNSIFLNATSSGTTFGSSGVFHTYVNSTTSAVLNLRNNIIVNTSTPKGTGITAAFRRSAATNLKNYATTSNNNLLFAGVPSSTRAIFVEGTTVWQTLAAFKTQVTPRETNSITESPPFLSTSGSDANFLKISTFAGTLIESGAVNIATYTTDFEGDIRAGNPGYPAQQNGFGTAPDIGADEFDGTMIQKELQSITYNQASTSTVLQGAPNQEILRLDFAVTGNFGTLNLNSIVVNSLNVSDDDVTGVKLYRTNTTTFSTANLLGSTTFIGGNATFLSLGYDLPAGTTYIWVAYDVSPTAIINNTLDAQIQANQINVAGSTYPTTNQSPAGSRTIKGPLAGIYTVGSTNCDYTTITAAISDLNILGLSANVTFMLNDATYPSESFPLIINVTNANIPSETKTVTIRPAESATVTISGPSANSQIFRILNSYIIIDGSNSGGSGRNLTIENTNATTPQVIRIGSTGTTAIVGVTIKNCIIINGVNTSTALVVYGADGAAGYFNNITIQNNSIQKTYIGIFFNGVVATGNGSGTLITQNDLNTSGANSIRLVGVYVQGVDGATVSNNTIGNISNSNAESVRAIWFATGTNSGTISWNTISNITLTNTGAFAVSGIYVTSATVTSLSIANNTISTLANSGTSLSYGIILTFSPNTNITNNVVSGITQNGAAAFWG
ncbi:MAG: hypothetical protein Q8M23_02435, partial [Bacteroidales bacterium]|nr:hypothetical protein [Bacteroidales bacterium]